MKEVTKALSWRDVLPVHPAADLFPMMTADETLVLGNDIKKNGLHATMVIWKEQKHFRPMLLDGRNRLAAMEAVGIEIKAEDIGTDADPHVRLLVKYSDVLGWVKIDNSYLRGDHGADPFALVVSLNVHRRHLTAEQKRDLIAKVLKAIPQKSNRQIAKAVGASHPHVGKIRTEMESAGDVETVSTSIDTKGRRQQAKRPVKPNTAAAVETSDAYPLSPSAQLYTADDVDEEEGVTMEVVDGANAAIRRRIFVKSADYAIRRAEQGAGLRDARGSEIDKEIFQLCNRVITAWSSLRAELKRRGGAS
ncbi:hypothetical protein [Bradyrhizobium sp. JYMT SZCCT0428]|uniref:hypothetical protein n=1 Tax=Bradyrhizobium sp. JYMT SZCCT0428 TaxID=2807673 RepID=UPI001BA5DA93|nr:hypothetical protein [Bradyrhizobium sp. JYMT SZCCT0428]MBR1153149.1 hypothetical protein [Bradyrhizobium sp. JYMT SZCCT0428]